ncbi:hypothetical protein EDB81DRAFT_805209 [Dactylonectria macrodidyma]|uniref:Uncharacterized protein n=1 Tax=Dactylonectria macrodidyma TaxID=307937 RepID=A0A9P9EB28_9HYPO|nr:hypothetical protein EDB81DRAFT_805209 [Dactylonectria macrodidyma]
MASSEGDTTENLDPPQLPDTKSCPKCSKRFARTEHLQRHLRIHTRETPFLCPYCRRGFQRSDVRNRHVARFCVSNTPGRAVHLANAEPSRVKVACDACRTQKLKCTGREPCSRCVASGRVCHFGRSDGKDPSLSSVSFGDDDDDKDNDEDGDEGEDEDGRLDGEEDDAPSVLSRRDSRTREKHPYHGNGEEGMVDSAASEHASISEGLMQPNVAPRPEQNLDSMSTGQASFSNRDDLGPASDTAPLDLPRCSPMHPSVASTAGAMDASPATPAPGPQLDEMVSFYFGMSQPPLQPPAGECLGQQSSNSYAWDLGLGLDSIVFNDNMFDLFPMAENFSWPDPFFNELAASAHQGGGMPLSRGLDIHMADAMTQPAAAPPITTTTFPGLNSDASRWLTTRPSLSNFDRLVVNRFINLFVHKVPQVFISFKDFCIKNSTTEEEVLAVASFGGLYCTAAGSLVIARAMCSDSRRLLLTRVQTAMPVDAERKISLIRCLLLLELFGIFSGDKRLCELSEAFHIQFLQILSQCSRSTLYTDAHYDLAFRVIHDFQILECYRTTLLQWPAYLHPGISLFGSMQPTSPQSLFHPVRGEILEVVKALLTPAGPPVDLSDSCINTSALTALLVLSSHSVPVKPADESECLWDKRFFELGLSNWLRSQDATVDASMLLLFHVGTIVLHTSMARVHSLVRAFCIRKSCLSSVIGPISQWRESPDCEVALLHAHRVLALGQQLIRTSSREASMHPVSRVSGLDEQTRGEAPHLSICVYLAAITIWAAHVSEQPSRHDAAIATLSQGCRVLQHLEIRIADGFGKILRRLEVICESERVGS